MSHPLDHFAREGLGIAFSGRNMSSSPLLADIKVFVVRFDAHQGQTGPLPQYAPLLAHVLCGLMGEEFVACLSADRGLAMQFRVLDDDAIYGWPDLACWLVDHELEPRGLRHFELVHPQPAPAAPGRFFFECPPDLASHYFQEYLMTIGIAEYEGYVLDRPSIALLPAWNLRERDAMLLDEAMDTCYAAFRTYSDNAGLAIITRRLDFAGFAERISLGGLVQLASSLNTDEQRPYWRMLERLDRFAYWLRVDRLADLRAEIGVALEEIGQQDSEWAKRFEQAWAALERAYEYPLSIYEARLPARRTALPIHALEGILASLGDIRAMIREKIRLLQREA